MKLAVYCELTTRDEAGEPDGQFGLCLNVGESETPVNYGELTKRLDKRALLELCCLSSVAAPEDVRIITEAEYEAEYGDDSPEPERD